MALALRNNYMIEQFDVGVEIFTQFRYFLFLLLSYSFSLWLIISLSILVLIMR
jgi:hypothetical protein